MAASLPPRPGVWFAKPRPVRRTLRKIPDWIAAPVAISIVAESIYTWQGHSPSVWVGILRAFGFLLALASVIWWRIAEILAQRTMREDRQFSDRPVGIVEYPIEIVILDGGKELGVDRGIAWFEDGLLCFNGAATSFTLAAEDIVPRGNSENSGPYRKLPSDSILIARAGAGTAAAVRLLPLNGLRRWRFGYGLGSFLSAKAEVRRRRQSPPFPRVRR